MGLPYKHCDRCRCTDVKFRNKHKEQIKVYRDQSFLDNQDKIKEYREVNKIKLKKKKYREANKDKINAKIVKESHVNVVVLQEEIRFPNIKNPHVTKNL